MAFKIKTMMMMIYHSFDGFKNEICIVMVRTLLEWEHSLSYSLKPIVEVQEYDQEQIYARPKDPDSSRINQDRYKYGRVVSQTQRTPTDVSVLEAKVHGRRQVQPEPSWTERSGQDHQKGKQ